MASHAHASHRLHVGAAQVDITPQTGVHLSGDISRHRPARLVWDPLYARAIVLGSGDRTVCILTLDVTIVTEDYTQRIRQAASEATGLQPDAIMVHAVQNHSAPSLGVFMVDPEFQGIPPEHEWIKGSEKGYSAWAADRAVEAIVKAHESLQPAQVGMGSGIEGRMAFNRRAVMRDGKVCMPGNAWPEPLGPTHIRYIEGPIDPELGVVCLRGDSLEMPAVVASYTCHPVHVFPRPIVSGDWPGALSEELANACAGDPVVLVVNGACGNINPWPPFDPDYVEDHRTMGRTLAQMASKVIKALEFSDEAPVDFAVRRLPIPLRELTSDDLQWARGLLDANPQPLWTDDSCTAVDSDWMVAASIWSVHLMRRRSETLDYEVQVIRIGDCAIVGLPGEPFVECGLQIKIASPTYPTYIAHCTTQYVGYIPTPDSLQRGGHEVSTRYWAKLAPEAFDMIVDGATGLLNEVFAGPDAGDAPA